MIETLSYYLTFAFVRYALIAGLLIAFCSSLLGVPLVLRRYALIGSGLSHVAFGAMAVGTIMKLTSTMTIVLPVTIITAIIILGIERTKKIQGDMVIAMLSTGALALGYLIMNVFSDSANVSGDVCSTLFGSTSILTLTPTDVILCVVMSIVVISFFVIFYHRIYALTLDASFAKATGTSVERHQLIMAVITAVVIVLAMNLVGSLLISALVVFPAVSAMQLCVSYKGVIIGASIIAVLAALLGMLAAILFGLPVGSTIVVVNIIIFAVAYMKKRFIGGLV